MKVLTLFQLFLKYCDHVSMFGAKFSKINIFNTKNDQIWSFFVLKMLIFENFAPNMLTWSQYFRKSWNNVRTFISYHITPWYHVYGSTTLYIYENSLLYNWPHTFFTRVRYTRCSKCWPKGQHLLTKISDLVKEVLSSLWLFLWLPETVWSLRNCLYTKKRPKKI